MGLSWNGWRDRGGTKRAGAVYVKELLDVCDFADCHWPLVDSWKRMAGDWSAGERAKEGHGL